MSSSNFAGLVLAAGKGTRFQSENEELLPKVLRRANGKPLIRYVLDTLNQAGIDDITVIVGFQAEQVMRELGSLAKYVMQEEQKGSGHAVLCAKDAYKGFKGHIVIMCGDSPAFRVETIRNLMQAHVSTNALVTLVTAILDDPSGYGRILRNSDNEIAGIVEEKCASSQQKAIREVNGGAYVFKSGWLFDNIHRMKINEAGEYNLTDMVRVAAEDGGTISSVQCESWELAGVNTPEQLKIIENILRG